MKGFRLGTGQIGMLIVYLIAGAVIGSLIGEALSPVFPLMKTSKEVELGPTTLNLISFSVTMGLALKLNLAGAAGMVAAFVFFRRS